MPSIAYNIKDLRERRGMSQDELGKLIGKTRSAISQYESGKITPRMGAIEDIAGVFGVTKDAIIDGITPDMSLTDDERELLACYRSLPAKGKHAVLAGLQDYANGK